MMDAATLSNLSRGACRLLRSPRWPPCCLGCFTWMLPQSATAVARRAAVVPRAAVRSAMAGAHTFPIDAPPST